MFSNGKLFKVEYKKPDMHMIYIWNVKYIGIFEDNMIIERTYMKSNSRNWNENTQVIVETEIRVKEKCCKGKHPAYPKSCTRTKVIHKS